MRAAELAGWDLYLALGELVAVIDAAGLHNLSRGVELGPTVWFVKASDAMELSKRALLKAERIPADGIANLDARG